MTTRPSVRIAAVTDDGRTISAHFGRARAYLVVTVVDGQVVGEELREKAGHHTFAAEPAHDHAHGHDHAHAHGDHGHDHGDRGHDHGDRGHDHGDHGHGHDHGDHGHGPGAAARHAAMTEPVRDCTVVLTRGMGRGAYEALRAAGIEPIVTTEADVAEAVRAYLDGRLANHLERLH